MSDGNLILFNEMSGYFPSFIPSYPLLNVDMASGLNTDPLISTPTLEQLVQLTWASKSLSWNTNLNYDFSFTSGGGTETDIGTITGSGTLNCNNNPTNYPAGLPPYLRAVQQIFGLVPLSTQGNIDALGTVAGTLTPASGPPNNYSYAPPHAGTPVASWFAPLTAEGGAFSTDYGETTSIVVSYDPVLLKYLTSFILNFSAGISQAMPVTTKRAFPLSMTFPWTQATGITVVMTVDGNTIDTSEITFWYQAGLYPGTFTIGGTITLNFDTFWT